MCVPFSVLQSRKFITSAEEIRCLSSGFKFILVLVPLKSFSISFIESTTIFNADAAENEMKRKGFQRNGLFGSRDSKCFLLFSINANLVSFGLREWIQLRYTLVA